MQQILTLKFRKHDNMHKSAKNQRYNSKSTTNSISTSQGTKKKDRQISRQRKENSLE